MKKFFAIIALVAFVNVISHAQTANTDQQAPAKQEVKKCTEAEKAKCDKEAAKTGAKCETHDMKASTDAKAAVNADAPDASGAATEKACDKSKAAGCCSKGTTSAGSSCCKKGGAKAEADAAPADTKKVKGKSVAVASVKEKK